MMGRKVLLSPRGRVYFLAALLVLAGCGSIGPQPTATMDLLPGMPPPEPATHPDSPSLQLRPGYTLWRGIPIPDYFSVMQERPSLYPLTPGNSGGDPNECVEVQFAAALTDNSQVRNEMESQWRAWGLLFVHSQHVIHTNIWRTPDGGELWEKWSSTSGGPLFWLCPRFRFNEF